MATHAFTTTIKPQPRRRALFAGAASIALGSGITAGIAATVADLVPPESDAELLSLRAELDAAVFDVGLCEMNTGWSDDLMDEAAERLSAACSAIVAAPHAQTPAGLALKATAVMHELRLGYSHGSWRNTAEAMAWQVLSPLAGAVYAPPYLPEAIRASCEPGRA